MKKKELKLWHGVVLLLLGIWLSNQCDMWILGEVIK